MTLSLVVAQLSQRAVQTSLSTEIKASLEGTADCGARRHGLGQPGFALSHSKGDEMALAAYLSPASACKADSP